MAKGGKGGGGNSGEIRGNKKDNTLTGTSGDDVMLGLGGNDTLYGGLGLDTLLGGYGDDFLFGNAGDDDIDGGDGSDTAVYSGLRSDYTIVQLDATTVQITGPDGTDLVTNVEFFQFDDITEDFATLITEPNLTAGGLTLSNTVLVDGGPATASWSVNSTGGRDADASASVLVIATAADMGSVVGQLAGAAISPLVAGGSQGVNSALDLSGLAPGTYYVAAVADSGDAIAESDEADNVSAWVQVTIEAPAKDLAVTDATVQQAASDLDITDGAASVAVDFSVANLGNDWVYTGGEIQIFLSSDQVISGDDVLLDTSNVTFNPGDTLSFSDVLSLAPGTVGGDYYVGVVIDGVNFGTNGAGLDVDLANNTMFSDMFTVWDGIIHGTSGNDELQGDSRDEQFFGYGGDDIIITSSGADVLDGGNGHDILDLSGASVGMALIPNAVTMAPGDYLVEDAAGVQWGGAPLQVSSSVVGFEEVIGTDFDDILATFDSDNPDHVSELTVFHAGAGHDLIFSSAADDTVDAGAGNDVIATMLGDDFIFTGGGNDQILVMRDVDGSASTGHGYDIVADFDPLLDALIVQYASGTPAYDPLTDMTQTVNGALINYADDSSVLLQGVDISQLNATNMIGFEEQPFVFY
ncbi:MAG: CARDB domain-containing protein [Paracoccaceae bacterium]